MSFAPSREASSALLLAGGEFTSKLLNFAFLVAIARGLGATEFGYVMFALSLVSLFLIVATWGTDSALIREMAQNHAKVSDLFVNGLLLILIVGALVCSLSFFIAIFFVNTGTAYLVVVLVGLGLFADSLSALFGSAFKAVERFELHAFVLVVNRTITTLAAVVALLFGADVVLVAVAYLIGSLVALGLAAVVYRRIFPPIRRSHASKVVFMHLLAIGRPLALAGFLSIAVYRIDFLLLQAIRGPLEVAFYGVGYRFFESFLFFGWIIATVVLPRLSRTATSASVTRIFELSAIFLLAFYLPLVICAPFVARPVIEALFSAQFSAAAQIALPLTVAALFYAFSHLSRTAIVALGGGRQLAYISGSTLLVNVIGNLVIIPRHGFVGAAWVTCGSEAANVLLFLVAYVRLNERPSLRRVAAGPVAACVGVTALIGAFAPSGIASIVIAAAAYPAFLVAAVYVAAPDHVRAFISSWRGTR